MSAHISIAQAHGKGGRCALDPETEKEVMKRIRSGDKKQKIADDLGVHRNTIRNIESRHRDEISAPGSNTPQGRASSTTPEGMATPIVAQTAGTTDSKEDQ